MQQDTVLTEEALQFFSYQCERIATNLLGASAKVTLEVESDFGKVLLNVYSRGQLLDAKSPEFIEIKRRFQRYLSTAKPN